MDDSAHPSCRGELVATPIALLEEGGRVSADGSDDGDGADNNTEAVGRDGTREGEAEVEEAEGSCCNS